MSPCPEIRNEDIASAGFFHVEKPFAAPFKNVFELKLSLESKLYLSESVSSKKAIESWKSEKCVWKFLEFEFPECGACEKQTESIEIFKRETYGNSDKLEFFRVIGSQFLSKEFEQTVGALRVIFDPYDHLFEQLAVQAAPANALIDPQGNVRGFFPGYVELNAPNFELFSWRLTGKKETVNGWVIPLALALIFLGLVGFLSYNLARWRRTVL